MNEVNTSVLTPEPAGENNLKIFWRVFHSLYCGVMFTVFFLAILPFFLLFMQRKSWFTYAARLNYWWAKIMFPVWGIPVEVSFEAPLDRSKQYILCANHFSYLDIPLLGLTPLDLTFIGKSSLAKIPLFGYMFRKLHITVDRKNMKSRYETIIRAREAIDEGKSIAIFPEGGISSPNPPQMVRFKDGAFRLAIEKQIPVIPVTIPYNWILLPDKKLVLQPGKAALIYHKPISTEGMSLDDLPQLKAKVYEVIDTELNKYAQL